MKRLRSPEPSERRPPRSPRRTTRGTCTLRIPRAQLQAPGLAGTGTRAITVSAEGDFVNGVDMVRVRQERRAGATADTLRAPPGNVDCRPGFMSIVVYWLAESGEPACRLFEPSALADALRHSEALRGQGLRHVCISSELPEQVGRAGVSAVEGGRLPGGADYTFNKRHRGAGPCR